MDRVRHRAWTSTSAATWRPSFALGGQVAGRIDEVKPVAEIIDETMREFAEVAKSMAALADNRPHLRLTRPFNALNASVMLTTATIRMARNACAMSPHAQPTMSNDRSPARM